MSAALILSLLATYGPSAIQLIDTLIAQAQAGGIVTTAEWATLSAALKLSASDHAKAQLTAAGIDPASPQGIAFLALVK
jgi:uncharacterized membrane protein YebE (DUF533 family)